MLVKTFGSAVYGVEAMTITFEVSSLGTSYRAALSRLSSALKSAPGRSKAGNTPVKRKPGAKAPETILTRYWFGTSRLKVLHLTNGPAIEPLIL